MLACSIFGYTKGNITPLIAPIDGENHLCGVGDFKNYTKLYFSDLTTPSLKNVFMKAVCVKECPATQSHEGIECMPTGNVTKCEPKSIGYSTKSLFNYCVPKDSTQLNGTPLLATWN